MKNSCKYKTYEDLTLFFFFLDMMSKNAEKPHDPNENPPPKPSPTLPSRETPVIASPLVNASEISLSKA